MTYSLFNLVIVLLASSLQGMVEFQNSGPVMDMKQIHALEALYSGAVIMIEGNLLAVVSSAVERHCYNKIESEVWLKNPLLLNYIKLSRR